MDVPDFGHGVMDHLQRVFSRKASGFHLLQQVAFKKTAATRAIQVDGAAAILMCGTGLLNQVPALLLLQSQTEAVERVWLVARMQSDSLKEHARAT